MSATRLSRVRLQPGADLDGFRDAARRLIGDGTPPSLVTWDNGDEGELFGETVLVEPAALMLPKTAAELVRLTICHSEPQRYCLLYTLIWRLTHGERALLEISSDPLVHRLQRMAKSVRRDLHKMHAFVRFRRLVLPDGERFIAWFEPEHFILEATAQFFVERFRGMDWAILTPKGSLHWDQRQLRIGSSASRADAPVSDGFEEHWLDYYASIFNPARLNPDVMRQHMAVKYWKNLPEAVVIPGLIRKAPARVQEMIEREAAMPTKRNPEKAVAAMADQTPKSLEDLNRLILASAPPPPFSSRAVLGEGPIDADIVFVGEQPGNQEDVDGRPFVGPAGRLLDQALEEAGIERAKIYITNAVKNFKFKAVGKRRIHQTPTTGEIKRFRWWLERELEFVRPKLVVALGATATQAMAGKALPVMQNRGPTDQFGVWRGFITVHPSSLLRQPDEPTRIANYRTFVNDLERVRKMALNLPAVCQTTDGTV